MAAWTRSIPALMAGCILSIAAISGTSAAYPDHPIHVYVGFPPGGTVDLMARIFSQKLSEKYGQPVIVENRNGANGAIAADAAARAAPDGYTLLFVDSNHTITPSMQKVNFDAVKAYAPIVRVGALPQVLVVNPTVLPVKSIAELVAYAKAHPGQLNYGSTPASAAYVAMRLFDKLTGTEMTNINYQGTGPVMVALLGGELHLAFANAKAAVEQMKAGKLKALAVTTLTRVPVMPDLPTIAEEIHDQSFDFSQWYGVLTPAGTPKEIVAKLHDDLAEAAQSADVKAKLYDSGFVGLPETSEQFGQFLVKDIARWAVLIKEFLPPQPAEK